MEAPIATVTVSPKYQIVIPKPIRDALGLQPGATLQIIQYEDRIEFIPVRKTREMRGVLKGINTAVPREKARG
jgi:AbrB family looped-hinge helix DNA binding protein